MGQDKTIFEIRDIELTEVDVYKYLGLHIDNNLSFYPHHKKLISQVNLKLSQFKKIRVFVTKKAAILIYKRTILPVIEYADFLQDQGIVFVNKAIQKLQNRGLLIAHNQHILPYDQNKKKEVRRQSCQYN